MRASYSVVRLALLLLCSSSLLSLSISCTTTSSSGPGNTGSSDGRREIIGLEEMSLEYIQTLWGQPDQSIPAGKGKLVRFKSIRTEDEDPITGAVKVKSCDVKLDVNEKQLVTTWAYEVCRPVN
ncbi:MAG: hypothetical protein EOP09_05165 [Proteobacteria bacterium]|nr:MAG: hypothetical protein EOP09_05165 [Pseudomonadota bacterium]